MRKKAADRAAAQVSAAESSSPLDSSESARRPSSKLSSEVLEARYQEARRFTSGTVFGSGNGVLNSVARDEVVRRREAREAKAAKAAEKRRKDLHDLREQVKDTRREIEKKGTKFKFTILTLKPLVKWKMLSANYQKPKPPKKDSVPTKKDLLLQKY